MDLSMVGDVIRGFFTGVFKDMKLIPHTAVSALLLWMLAWFAYFFIYPKFVVAADLATQVPQLQMSMSKLNATLIADKMDREIRQIEQDIFNLQREVDNLRQKKLQVPDSIYERLNTLANEKARKAQTLSQFQQRNAALLEPTL